LLKNWAGILGCVPQFLPIWQTKPQENECAKIMPNEKRLRISPILAKRLCNNCADQYWACPSGAQDWQLETRVAQTISRLFRLFGPRTGAEKPEKPRKSD